MSDFITDLDKAKPTEFDPVADGAAEIRSIKEALRSTFPYANTALTVSNESIAEAVQKVNSGEIGGGGGDIGTTKNLFAAVTYDGYNIVGTANNVASVDWVEQTSEGSQWKFAKVTFRDGFTGLATRQNGTLDANLNIQVTAFSNANNSLGSAGFVFGTVTEIFPDHVEIAFSQNGFNGSNAAVWNQAFCLIVAEN